MSEKDELLGCLALKEVANLLKAYENTHKAIYIGSRKIRRWKKEDALIFMESGGQA